MAKNLASIQRQIERLQQEATSLKKKEVGGVIARIKAAVEQYGITVADLFGGRGRRAKKGRGRPTAKTSGKTTRASRRGLKGSRVPPKYRDGHGNTWAGRGNQPRWLVAALKSGKKLEDFAI
jgi:DNA-binding protein H-NS